MEVIEELWLAKSKLDTFSVVVDDTSGNHADNQRLSDDVEKQLYQRIVAKIYYLVHDPLELVVCYLVSCQRSLCSQPWGSASSETCWTVLEESLRDVAGILLLRSLCYADADWPSDKEGSTSGGVVTLGGGVLGCWEKKQRSLARSSWESGLADKTRISGAVAVSSLFPTVRASLITRGAVVTEWRRKNVGLRVCGCKKRSWTRS